jgi:hypothetical protein
MSHEDERRYALHTHLGIDLGKESIMISWPTSEPARNWPVQELSYKEPDWHEKLLSLLAPGAIIVAEPTGISLITPIANVIRAFTTAQLWIVNHPTTGAIRQEHVSRTKNDQTDARTLALIATWINTPAQPHSARPYNHVLADDITTLRLNINTNRQLIKQRTRLLNQIEALGFSIWPALAQHKTTWLRCIEAGAITPDEIHNLIEQPPAELTGNHFHYIEKLAGKLPDLPVHPATRLTILQRWTELAAIEPAIKTALTTLTHIIEQPPFADVTAIWRTFPQPSDTELAAFHAACHGTLPDTYSEFRALLGSNPQGRSSGKSSKTRHSRSGYKPAAAALHMWTLRLMSTNAPPNPIKKYAASRDKFALAASRNKLAKILWICATRKEPCKW